VHWQEVQRQARESSNGGPTDADKQAVRESYHRHDQELTNPESRRLFEADRPSLDDAQKEVLERLNKDGLAVQPFTDLLDEGLWSRLEADASSFRERAMTELERKSGKQKKAKSLKALSPEKLAKMKEKEARRQKKFIQIREYRAPDSGKSGPRLTTDSPWFELASSARMLDVINTYLGLWTKATYIDEWYTPPSSSEADRQGSQQWHRDYNDQHLVKVFLYMRDVDEGTGPFEYVPGSARDGQYGNEWPWEPLGEVYPPAEEFEKRIPDSAVRTLTAPAGTLILCNTSGFHRGGFATDSARLLGVLNYTSPAALASLVSRNFRVDPSELPEATPEAVKFAFSDLG
jgi:hypothetical protein